MTEQDIYQKNGYHDREDYLNILASENGIPLVQVLMLADLLGPDEDFDGLVTGVEDYAGIYR